MKKFLAILLSVLMLISLLAACSNNNANDDEDNDKENEENKDNEENKNNEEDKAWTIADATKTLIYHSSGKAGSLDKFAASGGDPQSTCDMLIFDSLLIKDEEGTICANLATEWEMAEDFSTCRFKLRDDVYFTNGTKMTAEDVAFSIMRIVEDTENLADTYANTWRLYVEEMEVVNEYEVIMHFKQAMPEFWSTITVPTTGIVCKDYYEEVGYAKFWEAPVGTGAYKVVKWDAANNQLEVTIRDDEYGYWKWAVDESSHTNVKTIKYAASSEANTRTASLKTNEVHIIDNVSINDVPDLEAQGYEIIEVIPNTCMYLQTACNTTDLLYNRDLRAAISLSIDRELLVDTVLDGAAIPCDFACQEGQLGYSAYSDETKIKYDLDEAKELVENADYNGEAIRFVYSSGNPTTNEVCVAVSSMCGEAGLNVQLEPMEGSLYSAARLDHNFDLTIGSIGGGVADWYKLVNNVVGLDRFNTQFQNERLKELALSTGSILDREVLEGIYAEVYEIELTEFQPNIFLYWPLRNDACNADLEHILYHNYTAIDLSQVWIND